MTAVAYQGLGSLDGVLARAAAAARACSCWPRRRTPRRAATQQAVRADGLHGRGGRRRGCRGRGSADAGRSARSASSSARRCDSPTTGSSRRTGRHPRSWRPGSARRARSSPTCRALFGVASQPHVLVERLSERSRSRTRWTGGSRSGERARRWRHEIARPLPRSTGSRPPAPRSRHVAARAAVKAAIASRERRALEVAEAAWAGEPTAPEATLRVRELLMSIPSLGPTRADRVMEQLGIAASKRVGGLGIRQRDKLREYLHPARGRHGARRAGSSCWPGRRRSARARCRATSARTIPEVLAQHLGDDPAAAGRRGRRRALLLRVRRRSSTT